MEDLSPEQIKRKLIELQEEHRDLDEVISRLMEQAVYDQLQLQRLKKKKLALKDQIVTLQDKLTPDIIA